MTIAAIKAIRNAKVIVFPISSDYKKSSAAEIVKEYIKFKKKIPIIFPMARQEFDPNEIWSNAVDIIVKFIKNQETVALLCLGDTSLFASSSNIFRIIKNKHPEIMIFFKHQIIDNEIKSFKFLIIFSFWSRL